MAYSGREFKDFVRYLRTNLPAPKPIKVQTKEKLKYLGATYHRKDDILIVIDRTQSAQVMIDTLIHEWAHALSGTTTKEDSHPTQWGICYGRVYRAWVKFKYNLGEW